MNLNGPTSKKLQVVVRLRPQQKADNVWVTAINERRLRSINHRNQEESLEYEFEHVFGPESSQESVYETSVKPLLEFVLQGQNSSVFAYGPTGSGKTHTISGDISAPGIIPRCVKDLFSLISAELNKSLVGKGCRFSVYYSFLEVYNEKINDLLEAKFTDLPIRQGADQLLHVPGLTEKEIKSFDEFQESYFSASKLRMTASTKLNAHSSRSHAVLLLKVIKTDMRCSPFQKLCSKMYLIDLAGSEDNRRTGNEGIRLKESGAINTSLFMLAEVVDALNKGKSVIPYRQSKLTRLLQDSLGGNAHSVMIVNVAPEEQHYLDTISTLKLARKSKKIVNNIKTNDVTEKSQVATFTSVKSADKQCTKSSAITNGILSPIIRCQKHLESEVHHLRSEVESLKSLSHAGSSLCSGDDRVSTAGSPSEFTFYATDDQPRQSTPQRKSPRKALADIESMFNSPFALPPISKKRKTSVCSSVCSSRMVAFDSEQQQQQSLKVLTLLNGSLRELQQLQKIGNKKARLIYDWRMLNGPLESVDDLQNIPGFTGYKNFLQANLIQI